MAAKSAESATAHHTHARENRQNRQLPFVCTTHNCGENGENLSATTHLYLHDPLCIGLPSALQAENPLYHPARSTRKSKYRPFRPLPVRRQAVRHLNRKIGRIGNSGNWWDRHSCLSAIEIPATPAIGDFVQLPNFGRIGNCHCVQPGHSCPSHLCSGHLWPRARPFRPLPTAHLTYPHLGDLSTIPVDTHPPAYVDLIPTKVRGSVTAPAWINTRFLWTSTPDCAKLRQFRRTRVPLPYRLSRRIFGG
ncbi:MAG: hypothetical protein OJF49_002475 [Ktedonobacterales bacterium]|jgi:hypothetical protein|nr:MAG: hypothetical protein OJF49_002475 [Ktedonobacterales bacterium]